MRKKELLDQMKDMPDDARVSVVICFEDKNSIYVNNPIIDCDPYDDGGYILITNKIGDV